MAVTIETVKPPDQGRMDIQVRLAANIQVTAEAARRRVSVFVGNEIADLLHGETPMLVVSETGVYWRVPVVLSSRSWGRIGQVGTVDVDVETGELRVDEQIVAEIEHNAERFAASAAL
jgi:hypothetical protein